ncbi:MAG TPA: hypothetical protein VKH42_03855, partial [Vicinamibacterales bacterium]|nr:hypothetical protein [Vicinamibacterales bacterium]
VKTEADSIIAAAKAELGKAVEATNEARAQAARARDAHAKAEVARKELDAALHKEAKEKEAAVAEAKEAKALMDGLHAKQKAAEEQRVQLANQLKQTASKIESLERASAEADRKVGEAESKVSQAESKAADAERRIADAERRHAEAVAKAKVDAESAGRSGSALDLVLHSVQTLQGGNTIEDVLASLANGLTHDFSRVAVFLFANSRFSCTYEVGFGPKIDMSKATIPVTTDSPLTRALRSNKAESFAARALAESGCTMLAGTPQTVLTMPITVFDETLAVIYADDSDRKEKQNNGEQAASFAEVVRRFAIPLIEKRSIAPKLREELREYAALLLEELEYVHTSDVNAGKKEAEIRAHLKENLNGARDMYQQRVASEPPAAADLFDEKLRGIVDGKAASPFGKDLSAAAGLQPSAQPAKARAR